MMSKINLLRMLTIVMIICGYQGLTIPTSLATVTLEYTVNIDSPPDQADYVDVSLAIEGNADPEMYFIFCWYQNSNYKQNITSTISSKILSISAKDSNASELPIHMVQDDDTASQYGWEQPELWKVETNGASSLTISYRKKLEIDPFGSYESVLFLVPISTSVNQSNVTFQVPFGYKVIVPWKQVSENSFVVSNTSLRSWLANLVYVDILCIPPDYPVTKFTVDGISVEFVGVPFKENSYKYLCDVFKYLKQIYGGYEHERFMLFHDDSTRIPAIQFPRSFNGLNDLGFPDPYTEYYNPLDFLMDTYADGYKKFGKYNSSAFHEWSHHWNVIVLRSSESPGKWYHDGIANYFEAIGPRDIWGLNAIFEAQLYQSWDYYRENIESPINKPLYELSPFGNEGFENEVALMIYSKGMMFYFMLDKEFQARGKNFSDFVELVYSSFNSENPDTVHDFIALANTFVGDNLSEFMDKYLLGNEDYPLDELDAFKNSYYSLFGKDVQLLADFTADATNGSAPFVVSFTDQSIGYITSWFWDFGDDTTSNVQNPSHTYNEAGSYTVTLTVTGPEGSDTLTKADHITVRHPTNAMPWIPLLLLGD